MEKGKFLEHKVRSDFPPLFTEGPSQHLSLSTGGRAVGHIPCEFGHSGNSALKSRSTIVRKPFPD